MTALALGAVGAILLGLLLAGAGLFTQFVAEVKAIRMQLERLVIVEQASVFVADQNAKTSARMADQICGKPTPIAQTPTATVQPLRPNPDPIDPKATKH
jgi:hypothetical protein